MIRVIETCSLNHKILRDKQIQISLFYHKIEKVHLNTSNFRFKVQLKNIMGEKIDFFPFIIWGDFNNEEQSTYLLHYREITSIGLCDVTTNKVEYFDLKNIQNVSLYLKTKN